jgi:hypothetical protein
MVHGKVSDVETSDNHKYTNDHSTDRDTNIISSKRKRRTLCRPDYVHYDSIRIGTKKKTKDERKEEENVEDTFATTWICVECKEAECMIDPNATELLICDGICRRVFHYPCAGLLQLPDDTIPFICNDCCTNKHLCTICSNYGYDNEDVYKCSKQNCGLFYHESCLSMQNIDIAIVVGDNKQQEIHSNDRTNGSSNNSILLQSTLCTSSTAYTERTFICPAHSCWTCTQIDLQEQQQLQQEQQNENDIIATTTTGATNKKTKLTKKKKKKKYGIWESKKEQYLTVRS